MSSRWIWDVDVQELFPLGHGYPLWYPEPDPAPGEVEIGDVGFINQSGRCFYPLFNSMKPHIRLNDDVPSEFNPLDIPVSTIPKITQKMLCSRSIDPTDMQELNFGSGR